MRENLIHDRGRGPEIVGTRMTVFNLLPYFIDPEVTETYICQVCNLTPAQVSAARAYVFANADVVLDQHMQIEARIAQGNPPEVIENAQRTRATLQQFRQWLDEYRAADNRTPSDHAVLPSFRDWVVGQKSAAVEQP